MRGAAFSRSYSLSSSFASLMRSSAILRDSSSPTSEGYVALPTASSLPAVLPSSSLVAVQSRMSSTTWNAKPMSCAYFPRRSTSSSSAPARIAPAVTETSSSAPVLCAWMYLSVSSVTSSASAPSDMMSTTCPPTRPSLPTHLPTSTMTRSVRSAGTVLGVSRPMCSNACDSSASPARMAISSPYTLWLVGLPRRKSSLSMEGRSSWIRDMV
mmetsp:Transcript_14081/g.59338  ORF Transcript_14081/g.59338 Transcript_14081/m.59338 type:complete len:212 (+) Transcript_14081:1474-2109(+)